MEEKQYRWESCIRSVCPYTPGEQPKQPDMIKLNTNENPYPPAPGVLEAAGHLDLAAFRLYPDAANEPLVSTLAAHYGVSPEQVFVGVGSDDVLSLSFLTFFNSGKPIFFPDITYSFYPVWAKLYGIPYQTRPLDEAFHLRASDYALENGGVIFPNPNAPTALLEPLSVVEEILQHNQDVVVIVDEAYVDFAEHGSAMSLVQRYPNLLVVQTFSKSRSLAGMRIGFAIGSPLLIRALNDVKYSFNSYTMNQAALQLGTEAVKDEEYLKKQVKRICDTRKWVREALHGLGFQDTCSQANFLFVTHPQRDAAQIFQELRSRHIYVRYFAQPRIDQYLRITIGTDEQMQVLLGALKEILGWKGGRFG